MKITYENRKRSLMTRFKILVVTTLNICYLVAMVLCIQQTYLKQKDQQTYFVLFCFLYRIDKARFSTVRRARQYGRARDDSTRTNISVDRSRDISSQQPQEIQLARNNSYNDNLQIQKTHTLSATPTSDEQYELN